MSSDRVTAQQRRFVVERAKGCCEYCMSQMEFATQAFSVEHILPHTRGGSSEPENLALSCQGCNNHKFTKTEGFDPLTQETVPLFHPREQQWRDHFTWNEDYTIVIGLTPTGRATVNELCLNRSSVVNLRRVLFSCGEHPPSETLPESN
ncbi:HNH endonuclease [Leptolyngbya ohadii]|uniref:HNH endonuclease n=1 Tax=Leptolyngbya ohadii TaxID=1962290 RepID=UPI000B59D49B|nr:HNH endonuclease [Leptolyngbya ohadii]